MSNSIKITKGLMAIALGSIFGTGTGGYIGGSASGNYYTSLKVYKGVPPTTSDITAITGSSYLSSRSTDLLVTFDYSSLFGTISGNIVTIKNSAYVAATAGGVATWFILYVGSGQAQANMAIVGTITDTTGNGDLKLTNTTLVSGNSYRIQQLTMAIPLEYTY